MVGVIGRRGATGVLNIGISEKNCLNIGLSDGKIARIGRSEATIVDNEKIYRNIGTKT